MVIDLLISAILYDRDVSVRYSEQDLAIPQSSSQSQQHRSSSFVVKKKFRMPNYNLVASSWQLLPT